jgi:hypothetical protein
MRIADSRRSGRGLVEAVFNTPHLSTTEVAF